MPSPTTHSYDSVCPTRSAFDLWRAWPEADLVIVQGPYINVYIYICVDGKWPMARLLVVRLGSISNETFGRPIHNSHNKQKLTKHMKTDAGHSAAEPGIRSELIKVHFRVDLKGSSIESFGHWYRRCVWH